MVNFENPVAIDSLHVEIAKSIEKIDQTLEKLKDKAPDHKKSWFETFFECELDQELQFERTLLRSQKRKLQDILDALKLRPSSISLSMEETSIINYFKT